MRNFKIFVRYIGPYFLIILAFLFLISILYTTNYNTSKEVKTTYIESYLESGVQNLEDLLIQINALSVQISSSPDVLRLASYKMPLNHKYYSLIYSLKDTFTSLTTLHQPVDRLILTLPNGIIFSSDGRNFDSIEDFYGDFFEYENISQEEWIENQNNAFHFWEAMWLVTDKNKRDLYLTYNCKNNTVSSIHLTALIHQKNFIGMFIPAENLDEFGIRIVHDNHDVLFDNTGGLSPDSKYDFIEQRSANLNLSFSVYVPDSFYTASIAPLKEKLVRFILLIIAINVLLSIFFGLFNSKPLRSLIFTLQNWGMEADEDPIGATQTLLSQIDEDKNQIKKELAELKQTFTSVEFEYMISTNMAKSYVPTGVSLGAKSNLYVLILMRPDLNQLGQMEAISNIHSKIKNSMGFQQTIYRLSNQHMIMLFPYGKDLKDRVNSLISKINKLVRPIKIQCSTSGVFKDISQIRFAYLEAEFALYKGDFREADCVFFDDIDIKIDNPLLSISYYAPLISCLRADNPQKVNEFFAQLQENICKHRFTSHELEQILYILRSIVTNYVSSHESDLFVDFYTSEYFDRSEIGIRIKNIENVCKKIIQGNIDSKKSHNTALRQSIIDCIGSQYQNPNLSLTYLAEYFSVSAKYLSDFIREQFGKNYIEYIQEIRMSKAAELLLMSKLPIGKVGEKVGFTNSNTFYKAFKRYFDLSPSEYRQRKSHIDPINFGS